MALVDTLDGLRLAIEAMDPTVRFNSPPPAAVRDSIANRLTDATGSAPAELVDWYSWLEYELPIVYRSRRKRLPFHQWIPILFQPRAVHSTTDGICVFLFFGQGLDRDISAVIRPGDDSVRITTALKGDAPFVLAEDLESYLELWREVLANHALWRSGDFPWGVRDMNRLEEFKALASRIGYFL